MLFDFDGQSNCKQIQINNELATKPAKKNPKFLGSENENGQTEEFFVFICDSAFMEVDFAWDARLNECCACARHRIY